MDGDGECCVGVLCRYEGCVDGECFNEVLCFIGCNTTSIVYGLVHLSCYVQGKYIVYYIMCGCSGVRVTMCDSDNQEPLV